MVTAQQAKAIAERYQRAVELVEQGRVYRLHGGQDGDYIVVNGNDRAYLVNVHTGSCTCPDAHYRAAKLGVPCKHLLAAAIVHERQPAGGNHPHQSGAADRETEDVRALLDDVFFWASGQTG